MKIYPFSATVLAKKECLICQKNKTSSSGSDYEKLVKNTTDEGSHLLKSYAEMGKNEHMTVQLTSLSISQITATEFYYHRSCYRDISRKPKVTSEERKQQTQAYEKYYDLIKSYIQDCIIGQGDVLKLSKISQMYADMQEEYGIEVRGATNQMLKERLKIFFGESVSFFKKKATSAELIYSDKPAVNSKKLSTATNESDFVVKVAKLLRDEISSHGGTYDAWPPTSDELLNAEFIVPKFLDQFLRTLFSKNKAASFRVDRLVRSFAQDLVFSTSRGKTKTQKHTELGLVLKRKTGSKQIVSLLNKLGHCISYDEVNMVETAVAEE